MLEDAQCVVFQFSLPKEQSKVMIDAKDHPKSRVDSFLNVLFLLSIGFI